MHCAALPPSLAGQVLDSEDEEEASEEAEEEAEADPSMLLLANIDLSNEPIACEVRCSCSAVLCNCGCCAVPAW